MFQTTRWSLVVAARGPEARAALEELCATYWYPLYAFARRKGNQSEKAEDLVQGFFVQLLERDALGTADPDRGRFRSFLLTSFRNFSTNEHEREQALKRGGGRVRIPLDGGEERYGIEPAHAETPERTFLRDWALTLLAEVLKGLRATYVVKDKEAQFDGLKEYLTGGDTPYAAKAEQLGMTEGAVKVAVHRLRERYGNALRAAIADTLEEGGSVETEIAELFAALR